LLLLSLAEVEEIAGIEDPRTTAEEFLVPDERQCIWRDSKVLDSQRPIEQVAVIVSASSSWPGGFAGGVEDIEGLGDRAVLYGDSPMAILNAWDDGWEITVVVQKGVSAEPKTEREVAKELARLALSRLEPVQLPFPPST
jgi:hypothetical protein